MTLLLPELKLTSIFEVQVIEKDVELIPGLSDDLGLECLIRSHYTTYRIASQTCHVWRKLLETPFFHSYRKKRGYTHRMACLVQSISGKVSADETRKLADSLSYGITVFDSKSRTWERLSQVPKYPDGLPLFCQVASSEDKLVVMGGWDPMSFNPVKDVFVYDFAKQLWRQGKDMPSKRSFFAMGAIDGLVYIAGGHDENKSALKSAWVYNLRHNEWSELTQMTQERDECEGIVIGNEFWVVSGYDTNSQGVFGLSAEAYCVTTGTWKLVDSVWNSGKCPRLSVMGLKNGKLVSCTELDSAVPTGSCGIKLGRKFLVKGSGQGGENNGVILLDIYEGQTCQIEKVDVPEEFCGVVQSACCVEI